MIALFEEGNLTKTPTHPPKYQWLETADGSYTLFSEAFQEACHSTTGAWEETLLHYVKGCQIEDKLQSKKMLKILEVGFGLGIGFLATFETLKKFSFPWNFLSLEIDEELLEWFRLENKDHPFLKNLQWVNEKEFKILSCKDHGIEIDILCGDARVVLPHYLQAHPQKWDAIYQDAFSPKKNPALWTVEWFKLLREYSQEDVILSTYSASTSIRKSLVEADWRVQKGEKFGPKRSSTRAGIKGESDPEILLHLERSPVSALFDQKIQSDQK